MQPCVCGQSQQATQDAGLLGGGWLVQPGATQRMSASLPENGSLPLHRSAQIEVGLGLGGSSPPLPVPRGPRCSQACGHIPAVCSGFTRSHFTWDTGQWSQGPLILRRV